MDNFIRKKWPLALLVSILCFINGLSAPATAAERWTRQNSGITAHLFTAHFLNYAYGYAAGDSGVIIKTTNGGQQWLRVISPTTQPISSIVFLNPDTGWIGGNQGFIFKTTDGGTSWIQQNSNTSLDISDLYFLNDRLGWGVTITPSPVYLRTTNGGDQWDTLRSIGFPINSIFFLDSLQGFSCGGRFDWLGFVNQTVNGGLTWTAVQPIVQETMFEVAFLNPDFGITVGGDHDYFGSLAYQTSDGGKTWNLQSISDTVPSPLIGLSFLDSNHAWACGWGKIYKGNPALELWTELNDTITRWTWYGVSFAGNDRGWFVGAYGAILHYDNTPLSVDDGAPTVKNFFLYPNYPNPFNPSTTLRCSVDKPVYAELTVFNVLGQPVKTLFTGNLASGEHRWLWDGTNQNHNAVASGVYIAQLKINHRLAASRKMILMR